MVSFDQKNFFFLFAEFLSHYSRMICRVPKDQDFFLFEKKIVSLRMNLT